MNLKPVIKSQLKNFAQKFSLEKKEEAELFEYFVNYNILYEHDCRAFQGSTDILSFISVGSSNDMGIDGIAIKINGELLESPEHLDDLLKRRRINVEFIFIQSKFQLKFDIGDYQKFLTGVAAFLSDNQLQPVNEKIKRFIEFKNRILFDDDLDWENNPTFRLYYVMLNEEEEYAHVKDAEAQFFENIRNINRYDILEDAISIIGSRRLKDLCDMNENEYKGKIETSSKMSLDSVDGVDNSCLVTCSADSFNHFLSTEDGLLRANLFNDNVRDYQGETSINKEIEKTIENQPESFALLNNGITIVCDEYKENNKTLTLTNPQIVNGCQTSNVIYRMSQRKIDLKCVPVSIKIIATKNERLIAQIVRGTNKQNIVYDEAFEATKTYHKDLESFFPAVDNPIGLKFYYERRSKQYGERRDIKQKQKFSLKNLLQGYVGIFLKAPEQAYHHQFWLLHEFKKTAFKNDDSPWKYYTVAFLEYEIREFFDENNLLYKKYKPFLYHLLMVCYLQFSQNISMKENKWEEYSKKIMDSVYKNKSIFARAIQIFEYTKMIWITSGKSIDGIKDVKEFKELLIKYAEKYSLSRLDQQNIGVVSFVGKVKNAKNYGFIHPDGNGEEIFFHHANNTHLIFDTIDQESVTYEVEEYIRYGCPARRAVNVFVSPCTNKDNYNI